MLRSPRPTLKGIQQVIDSGTIGKVDVKPERLVDFSIVEELEKSGFNRRGIRTEFNDITTQCSQHNKM